MRDAREGIMMVLKGLATARRARGEGVRVRKRYGEEREERIRNRYARRARGEGRELILSVGEVRVAEIDTERWEGEGAEARHARHA